MRFAHCSETWLNLPHLPENLENGPNIKGSATARRLGRGRGPFEVDYFHAPPIGIMLNDEKFDTEPPEPLTRQ